MYLWNVLVVTVYHNFVCHRCFLSGLIRAISLSKRRAIETVCMNLLANYVHIL